MTSRAAGEPLFHEGRKMSAGRECEPDRRKGASNFGDRAASLAAEKITSLKALCLVILSL